MESKTNSKIKNAEKLPTPSSSSIPTTTTTTTTQSDTSLPLYYDSEPSSQPPKYLHPKSTPSSSQAHHKKSHSQSVSPPQNPRHAPASASSIAAVLALPTAAQREEDMRKKPLRERWKAWKERHFDVWEPSGTRPELNVMGVSVRDWGSGTKMKGPGSRSRSRR